MNIGKKKTVLNGKYLKIVFRKQMTYDFKENDRFMLFMEESQLKTGE